MEFIVLTRLINEENYILPINRIAAIKSSDTGSDVYVDGLNQWIQVKETADDIAELLARIFGA